jgi:hypothetical protein
MKFTVTCFEELAEKLFQIEGIRRSRSHIQSVVTKKQAEATDRRENTGESQ